jgi:protocatechuate 3,4-dioxygenase beta subunit
MPIPPFSRRRLIALGGGLTCAALLGPLRPAVGEATLQPTPRQSAGPFYPQVKPVDADADLVTVAGAGGTAAGTVTLIEGRVLGRDGRPAAAAVVEIWQCDAFGRYHHPYDGGGGDPSFQGYGATRTAADGGYRFRTIRPVPYPGRAPHIHFAISGPGFERLTTQMYVAGEPLNDTDFLLGRIADPARRQALIVPLAPAPAAAGASLAGRFDIVLG